MATNFYCCIIFSSLFFPLCGPLCFIMAFPWVNRRWGLRWAVGRGESWRSGRLWKAWRCPRTYRYWSCGRWLADCRCRVSWWSLKMVKPCCENLHRQKQNNHFQQSVTHLVWQVPMQTGNTMTGVSPQAFLLWVHRAAAWNGTSPGCFQRFPLRLWPGSSLSPWPTGPRCRSGECAHVRYRRGHSPWRHLLPEEIETGRRSFLHQFLTFFMPNWHKEG